MNLEEFRAMPPFARHTTLAAQCALNAINPPQANIDEIVALHNEGVRHAAIGARFNKTPKEINDIVRRVKRRGGHVVNQRTTFGLCRAEQQT